MDRQQQPNFQSRTVWWPKQLLRAHRQFPASCHPMLRLSHRGVPYFTFSHDGMTKSVCWFGRRKVWRLFWPFASDTQEKMDFADSRDLLEHLGFVDPMSQKETTEKT